MAIVALPLNGALMTPDQFDALEAYVRESGSPMEQAMFRQMQVMVNGATAHRLLLERERNCRMEAERSEGELVAVLMKLQGLLQIQKKATKADLAKIIENARAEVVKAMEE